MKTIPGFAVVLLLACSISIRAAEESIPNKMIDYQGFLQNAEAVGKLRAQRRITEAEFIRMAKEPGTIVFDARSDSKFAMFHIKGAKHLSLPDVTADELAKIIPDKTTRVLIYCNNNFVGAQQPFPTKMPTASLNLSTYIALFNYGYRNVYELGPLLDIKTSKLDFIAASTRE